MLGKERAVLLCATRARCESRRMHVFKCIILLLLGGKARCTQAAYYVSRTRELFKRKELRCNTNIVRRRHVRRCPCGCWKH